MNKIGTTLTVAGLAFLGFNLSIYTVYPGERALIMNNITGLKQTINNPGFNFRIPIIEKPIIYDCKLKPTDISVATGTKDLQTVNISLRILQQPIVQALPTIHQLLGRDYEKKVFNSVGQQVLRTVVAQYDADQLLKNREVISKQIRQQLYEKSKDFNVNVEDVSFMHLGFGYEYAQAVERRAVQQQLAERQRFVVLKDEQIKNAQIIRAQAEAQAAKLINTSVEKFGTTQIEIKKLEASLSIAELLAKNSKITFVPSNISGNLLNFSV